MNYFTVPMFNALFIPYISDSTVGIIEFILSIILFNIILILRTSVIEYTHLSPLPKWNVIISQLGLYLQGMLATIIFFDGFEAVFNNNPPSDPHVFLVLLVISAIAIKAPILYKAYFDLIKRKKFFIDWNQGFFV